MSLAASVVKCFAVETSCILRIATIIALSFICKAFVPSSRVPYHYLKRIKFHSSIFATMPPKKKIEPSQDEKSNEGSPVKKARAPSKANATEATEDGEAAPVLTKKEKAAISAEKNGAHIRDIVVPKPLDGNHKFLKIISWNVNGFKALHANNLHVLTNLVANHKPDILCLQVISQMHCCESLDNKCMV